MRSNTFFSFTIAVAIFSAGVWACSDDEDTNPGGPGGDGTSSGGTSGGTTPPGGDGGDDDPSVPPIYALVSQVATTGTETTSYVIVTDKLTGALEPSSAQIEVDGTAVIAAPRDGKTLFVGTTTTSTLKRYLLDDAGELNEDTSAALDFGAAGLSTLAGYSANFEFVSADKAYWFSREGKIVAWNPQDFSITKTIDIPDTVRANHNTSFSGSPAIRNGSKLYTFASWDTRAAGTVTVPAAAAVVVLDTATDTAEVVVDEAGCGYGRDAVRDGDWLYIATEAVGTSVHYLNDANGPEPCLRRFNIATNQFDADFNVKLNGLAGAPVGSLAVSANGKALLHVLDTTQDLSTLTNPRVLSSAPVWKTARLTVGDAPTLEILAQPLRSSSVQTAILSSDLAVTPSYDTTGATTPSINEITADGIVGTDRANATVTGTTWGITRIR